MIVWVECRVIRRDFRLVVISKAKAELEKPGEAVVYASSCATCRRRLIKNGGNLRIMAAGTFGKDIISTSEHSAWLMAGRFGSKEFLPCWSCR